MGTRRFKMRPGGGWRVVLWTLETNGWTILTWRIRTNRSSKHICDFLPLSEFQTEYICDVLYIDVRPGSAAVLISRFWSDFAEYAFGLSKPHLVCKNRIWFVK